MRVGEDTAPQPRHRHLVEHDDTGGIAHGQGARTVKVMVFGVSSSTVRSNVVVGPTTTRRRSAGSDRPKLNRSAYENLADGGLLHHVVDVTVIPSPNPGRRPTKWSGPQWPSRSWMFPVSFGSPSSSQETAFSSARRGGTSSG